MAPLIDSLSPYRLTLVAAILVLLLAVGVVDVLGGTAQAGSYLALVASAAIPGLLSLFRMERNTRERDIQHSENSAKLADLQQAQGKLETLMDQIQGGNGAGGGERG